MGRHLLFKNRGMNTLAIAALLAAAACLSGCGGGGGGGGSVAVVGPTISNAQVLPGTWSSGGGTASIEVNVSDPNGVTAVIATVTAPSGTTTTMLTQASGTAAYSGEYIVSANTSVAGAAEVYSVVISATNTKGTASSAAPVSFSIPAPSSPPSPPSGS